MAAARNMRLAPGFIITKVYDYVSSSELRTEPEYKDS
jgi:hypothetical protein